MIDSNHHSFDLLFSAGLKNPLDAFKVVNQKLEHNITQFDFKWGVGYKMYKVYYPIEILAIMSVERRLKITFVVSYFGCT